MPETLSVQGDIMHAEHTHTQTQALPVASAAIVVVSTSQLPSSPPGKKECISDKNDTFSFLCVCTSKGEGRNNRINS